MHAHSLKINYGRRATQRDLFWGRGCATTPYRPRSYSCSITSDGSPNSSQPTAKIRVFDGNPPLVFARYGQGFRGVSNANYGVRACEIAQAIMIDRVPGAHRLCCGFDGLPYTGTPSTLANSHLTSKATPNFGGDSVCHREITPTPIVGHALSVDD